MVRCDVRIRAISGIAACSCGSLCSFEKPWNDAVLDDPVVCPVCGCDAVIEPDSVLVHMEAR